MRAYILCIYITHMLKIQRTLLQMLGQIYYRSTARGKARAFGGAAGGGGGAGGSALAGGTGAGGGARGRCVWPERNPWGGSMSPKGVGQGVGTRRVQVMNRPYSAGLRGNIVFSGGRRKVRMHVTGNWSSGRQYENGWERANVLPQLCIKTRLGSGGIFVVSGRPSIANDTDKRREGN